MNRLLPLILATALLGLTASAVPAQAATGESCSLIEAEVKRLLCYDLVFRTAPMQSQSPAMPTDDLEEPIDPAVAEAWPETSTPLPNGKGLLTSITTISSSQITDSDQYAKLTVSCVSGTTALSFWFPGYFMSSEGDGRVLKANIDGGGEDLQTTGADSIMNITGGGQVLPFVQKMMAGNDLSVSATPSSGTPISASFSLKGLTQAIRPIRQECNW